MMNKEKEIISAYDLPLEKIKEALHKVPEKARMERLARVLSEGPDVKNAALYDLYSFDESVLKDRFGIVRK